MSDFEKKPGEVVLIVAKWGEFLEYLWQKKVKQSLNSFVRPTKFNGFEYECTIGGYTGSIEPPWPEVIGGTVIDGSIVWTCRAYNDQATDEIQSTIWTVPTGLTKGTVTTDLLNTRVKVSAGDSLSEYTLVSRIVSRDGREEEQDITLSVV